MFTFMFAPLRAPPPCSRPQYVQTVFYCSQLKEASKKKTGKVVNVAIIGAPNSGKSTLINNIVERKLCAASNKVHTTTRLARAICYSNDTQIVFLDTPGVVTHREQKKYKLPDSMLAACHKSLRCADVIGVVHDVSNRWSKDRLHLEVLQILEVGDGIPSFLILNKVDQLKSKRQLLSTIKNVTNGLIAGNPIPGAEAKDQKENKSGRKQENGYSHFSDVFLVSALKGDGVKEIKDYLVNNAKVRTLQYDPAEFTDQTHETLVEQAVRAKFLDFLAQEIPYNLNIFLEYYEESANEDKIVCSVIVECPSERLMRLISGAGGGRLQQIRSSVRTDLIELFKKPVLIDLHLKVRNKSTADDELV